MGDVLDLVADVAVIYLAVFVVIKYGGRGKHGNR